MTRTKAIKSQKIALFSSHCNIGMRNLIRRFVDYILLPLHFHADRHSHQPSAALLMHVLTYTCMFDAQNYPAISGGHERKKNKAFQNVVKMNFENGLETICVVIIIIGMTLSTTYFGMNGKTAPQNKCNKCNNSSNQKNEVLNRLKQAYILFLENFE